MIDPISKGCGEDSAMDTTKSSFCYNDRHACTHMQPPYMHKQVLVYRHACCAIKKKSRKRTFGRVVLCWSLLLLRQAIPLADVPDPSSVLGDEISRQLPPS